MVASDFLRMETGIQGLEQESHDIQTRKKLSLALGMKHNHTTRVQGLCTLGICESTHRLESIKYKSFTLIPHSESSSLASK